MNDARISSFGVTALTRTGETLMIPFNLQPLTSNLQLLADHAAFLYDSGTAVGLVSSTENWSLRARS